VPCDHHKIDHLNTGGKEKTIDKIQTGSQHI